MTRGETLSEALTAWTPVGPGPHTLQQELGAGASASLSAERTDEFSALLTELTLTTGVEEPVSAADLTGRAVATAARVTGLADPLTVYEVDSARGTALLRSAKPAQRGDHVQYFELTLRGMQAAGLKRYRASRTAPGRESVPFVLTREALAKVVDEILG